MPWGMQRLNAKKSRPNDHINFIKPLAGPDEKTAEDFLERIAAQCLPVMREHHLYVMTLEEFPPNREFVGRNFNGGEVVQLVLKSPGSGRWLPFEYVQMVMMHELAHCKQMNHSRAFWAVRNAYASQMRGLWSKGYTGDGIWGRGATLSTGLWERDTVISGEGLPEHLCGGTFRSRGRKRKTKPTLSYQERKQRRIEKKFGKNGVSLGADDEAKVKLEKGKRIQAKPRVAGSARGRELRAAAALARFDKQKGDSVKSESVKAEEISSDSDESDYDGYDWPDLDPDSKDAVDVDGGRLVDGKGRGLVRVCEDETTDDPGAKVELEELQGVFKGGRRTIKLESSDDEEESHGTAPTATRTVKVKDEPEESHPVPRSVAAAGTSVPGTLGQREKTKPEKKGPAAADPKGRRMGTPATRTTTCPLCSFANPPAAVTCGMCANVLDPATVAGCWRCPRAGCRESSYRNAVDCGVCGLCGQRKPDGT